MVGYQYTYLLLDLMILCFWLLFFVKRKDTRKEILVISLIFGIIGILAGYIYVIDWWKPLTIIDGIRIEDFLFGFVIGGISSVIYEFFFDKRIKIKRKGKIKERERNINMIFIGSFLAILPIGVFLFNLNSFISTILALGIPTLIIWTKRKDLIKDSILSGASTLVVSIIVYQILNLITPGFFDEFWLFQNIGRIMIFKIPLEEIVWFFMAGAFIGPLYEYWKEGKLINIKR